MTQNNLNKLLIVFFFGTHTTYHYIKIQEFICNSNFTEIKDLLS